jgi:hypothetical protein
MNKKSKVKLFRFLYPILMKFPNCMFFIFWSSLRSLVDTEEERVARNEFHESCLKAVRIEELSNEYPQDNNLKSSLEQARRDETDAYHKLTAFCDKYGDYSKRSFQDE